MRQYFIILNGLLVALVFASFVNVARAQVERRPCVARNYPPGCVTHMGLPKPMVSGVADPDNRGVVPFNETPLGQKLTGQSEKEIPSVPTNTGTVTVSPATSEGQGAPE